MSAQVTYIASSKIRAEARKEFNSIFEEVLAEAIGKAIGIRVGEAEARCAALEAKLNGLQAAISEFRFVGQWHEGKSCRAGNFVTTGGQVWHCNTDTNSRPGTDSTWTLAVKSGRDGRDGKDAPTEPPAPRTVRSQR